MIDIMKQGLGLRTPQQERFGNSQELKSFGGRYRTRTARPRRRRGKQQPSGLLVSLRVPISRNVYQDKCCADALHRRIFLFGGVPGGTRTARHYFLLKKHVQNTSGRNGSCVLCTCFLLFGIHPNGQRLICCRICAISALE